MRVLVLAEKMKDAVSVVSSFRANGLEAKYLRLSKVVLVSRKNKTIIRLVNNNIEDYDAVYLIASPSLAPFVEPLIEELSSQGFYVNASPGSFYMGQNEPLLFVTLAMNNVSAPRIIVSGSGKNIELVSKKIFYPIIAKSFVGKDVQQSLIVNNIKELNSFVTSIKKDVDGFMLREFIENDVVSCAVVGEHVFSIKRKLVDNVPQKLSKGSSYKLNDSEKENVLLAAKTCGLDIARVDISKGKVISVEPKIPFKSFDAVCSENIESFAAKLFAEKISKLERKSLFTELKGVKYIFSKTFLGRFFK